MTDNTNHIDQQSVNRMFEKLRDFVATLDEDERAVFAALVGPGVALAYRDDDVEGFGVSWAPDPLPTHLASAVRDLGIEVIGLDS